ncbi:unnamed protein product [Ambrosiozyma monospora]|uniref:Unnamed protein product n=1 Tax=Ambrosiozyma monospora TaxID=43982 RepID=A0ACB5T157_AMBMO|nr:unnamed protein product [Ambrosiozyma monospora]
MAEPLEVNIPITHEDNGEDAPRKLIVNPPPAALEQDEEDELEESTQSLSMFFYRCGINLILPFVNGMMLGFGEILAHEIGFKYNWAGARVCSNFHAVSPMTIP